MKKHQECIREFCPGLILKHIRTCIYDTMGINLPIPPSSNIYFALKRTHPRHISSASVVALTLLLTVRSESQSGGFISLVCRCCLHAHALVVVAYMSFPSYRPPVSCSAAPYCAVFAPAQSVMFHSITYWFVSTSISELHDRLQLEMCCKL